MQEPKEKMIVQPSHFSYQVGYTIRDTTNRHQPVDNVPAAGTEIVATLLRNYGFLTRRLLSRCLLSHKHGTIDPVKTLRKMQQQEYVWKYTIETGTGDDLSIFCLTDKAREEIPSLKGFRYDMTNIPYLLEELAAAQWSIAIKSDSSVTELIYGEYVQTSDKVVRMPSLVRFSHRPGRNMYIAAVPVCRDKSPDGLRRFLDQLDGLNRYFAANYKRYKSVQVVLICESIKQIEDLCRIIARITELAGRFYLYTVDSLTADDELHPLELLYGADLMDNGNVELSVYSLKAASMQELSGKALTRAKEVADKAIQKIKGEA